MLAERIMVLGVNHKTTPVEIRERLAFSDPREPLKKLFSIPEVEECCLLSTCNRVEVFSVGNPTDSVKAGIRNMLFANSGVTDKETERYTFIFQEVEAVNHLFRVAASLDSMIVGEVQILGQLKQAFRDATEQNCTGVILNRFVQKSFSVAKRIRTETKIGSNAVSISYAAVELAKKIFGNLKNKKVLLVGAGEMAELAAEHLITQGVGEVIVANRTFERAVNLARRFNGSAVALSELISQLEIADIIISSTGASDLVLRKQDVKPVMRQRKHRPLFLIDIAVPRDLDPEINDLDNVYLFDIDDLQNVIEVNKSERQKEAGKAERIVKEETLKFMQWLENFEVTPTIVAIREKADAIRTAELAKTLSQLKDLSPGEIKSIEILTTSLVNKLLHDPLKFLKLNGAADEREVKLDLTRKLFGLDSEAHGKPGRRG
ncbi:MAG: glutamyl-tRNA reductase [Desulfobulbaceae bacterium]|nr:glutamyl-tRNA reductase [Desulfobulbaceae bacterium]MCK5322618.1 glutamyl-tRNA reductase [Desulfobulbaceae bacterium]MCK5436370.1 glutamyl-tRNA reductase [Desulfobulbaceae bacterium]MCK5545158.1 glutamyl-tRNA reductase [Desulfobulbaceae bacterium]